MTDTIIDRYVPLAGCLAYDPTRPVRQGDLPRYVGREWDATTRAHKATGKPFEVKHGSKAARRMAKLARRGDGVAAFDAATAARNGIRPFVEMTRGEGGEWVAKPASKPAPRTEKED
jgi:hypothetical protein